MVMFKVFVSAVMAGMLSPLMFHDGQQQETPVVKPSGSQWDVGAWQQVARESVPSAPGRVQWWVFTADWCKPCRVSEADYKPWMMKGGWRVSTADDAHVKLIDGSRYPDLMATHNVRSFPTFILFDTDGCEIERHETYPGRDVLVARYNDVVRLPNARQSNVGAIEIGKVPGKEQSKQLLSSLAPLLGSGGELTVKYARNGKPIPLAIEGIGLTLPGELTAKWTMQNGVLNIGFNQAVRVTVAGLPLSIWVDGIRLSEDELTASIPWLPDASITLE